MRVRAASLNRGELLGAGSTAKPAGMDAAGEIEKLGAGCSSRELQGWVNKVSKAIG